MITYTTDQIDTANKYFPDIVIDGNYIKNDCIKIVIDDLTLILSHISKSTENSGTQIIEKIISLAKELNLKQIKLTDLSLVYLEDKLSKCVFNLSNYYILTTEESWYNKYGFYSKSHSSDLSHNNRIRQLTLAEFSKKGVEKKNIIKLTDKYKELSQKQLEEIKRLSEQAALKFKMEFFTEFPEFDPTTSIGEIFNIIKQNYKLTTCTDKKTDMIIKLVNLSWYLFEYKPDLVKTI
jgi:hypothetical protein